MLVVNIKKTKAGNCIKSKFQNLICTIVNPGKVHWIQTQSFWRHHRSATHSTVLTDSLYMHTLLYLTAQIQTSQLLRSALQLSHRTVLWLCTWFNLHDSTAPSPHFFYKHDLKKKKTKTALQTVCPCIFLKYIHIIFEVRQLTLWILFSALFLHKDYVFILCSILCFTLHTSHLTDSSCFGVSSICQYVYH